MQTLTRYALAVALLILAACGGGPTEPSDYEFGRIDVYVRDAAGQPVNGAAVRLDRMNGGTEDQGGVTGSAGLPGYYFFLKTDGEYRLVVTPPAGYQFASGQLGTQVVQFTRNQTKTINLVVNAG